MRRAALTRGPREIADFVGWAEVASGDGRGGRSGS